VAKEYDEARRWRWHVPCHFHLVVDVFFVWYNPVWSGRPCISGEALMRFVIAGGAFVLLAPL